MKINLSSVPVEKAMMYGSSNPEGINNRNKMIQAIKFMAENMDEYAPWIKKLKVNPNSQVYNVFKQSKFQDSLFRLDKQFFNGEIKFVPRTEKADPHLDISVCSNEKHYNFYAWQVSYLPILKANDLDAHDLILEMLSLLAEKGIDVFSSSFIDLDDPEYNSEQMEERYNGILINKNYDEADEYLMDIYKWHLRKDYDYDYIIKYIVGGYSPKKMRKLIRSLPMNRQYHYALKFLAENMLILELSNDMAYYEAKSVENFALTNYNSMEEFEDSECQPFNYSAIFFVSNRPGYFQGEYLASFIESYVNEYGFISFVDKFNAFDKKDVKRLMKEYRKNHSLLFDLCFIFIEAENVSNSIENYYYEQFGKKWKKDLKKWKIEDLIASLF